MGKVIYMTHSELVECAKVFGGPPDKRFGKHSASGEMEAVRGYCGSFFHDDANDARDNGYAVCPNCSAPVNIDATMPDVHQVEIILFWRGEFYSN